MTSKQMQGRPYKSVRAARDKKMKARKNQELDTSFVVVETPNEVNFDKKLARIYM